MSISKSQVQCPKVPVIKHIRNANAEPPWSKTFLKKAIPEITKLTIEINNTVIGSGNIKKLPSQLHQNEL